MTNQVTGYDLTIKATDGIDQRDNIIKALREYCSKWVFQLERGEGKEEKTGYLHYQVRMRLSKKKRLAEAVNMLKETALKGHLSITSTGVHRTNSFHYVMSADTRVNGPWKDDDVGVEDEPEDIKGITLRPWQKVIYDCCKLKCKDTRTVYVVYDPTGGIGKTTIKKKIRWDKVGCVIPAFAKFEDMAACILARKGENCYLIDVPKSLTPKDMVGFWSGIESLKDGYAFDKRYKFHDAQFNSPHVWVFTNTMPDVTLMSRDRWAVKMVDWNGSMIAWTEAREKHILDAWHEDHPEADPLECLKRTASAPEEADQPRCKRPRAAAAAGPETDQPSAVPDLLSGPASPPLSPSTQLLEEPVLL